MADRSTRLHDVFLSYSERDRKLAQTLCALLEQDGIRCWIAYRDIPPGENWPERIVQAIKGSRVLVLILSTESNASNQVFREVTNALEAGVVVIPFRINEVEPSERLKFYLSDINWLDAVSEPIEAHIKTLAQRILGLVKDTDSERSQEPQRPAAPAPKPAAMQAGKDRRGWLATGLAAVLAIAAVAIWQPWQATTQLPSAASPGPLSAQTANVEAAAAEPKLSLAQREDRERVTMEALQRFVQKLEARAPAEELGVVQFEAAVADLETIQAAAGMEWRCEAVGRLFMAGQLLIQSYDTYEETAWSLVDRSDGLRASLDCPASHRWLIWWVLSNGASLARDEKRPPLYPNELEARWRQALATLARNDDGDFDQPGTWLYAVITHLELAKYYLESRDFGRARKEAKEAIELCQANLPGADQSFANWCATAHSTAHSVEKAASEVEFLHAEPPKPSISTPDRPM